MLIFDLYAGTGSATKAFADAGDQVITFEKDVSFDVTHHVDVTKLNAEALLAKYGRPDFIWASPPCTTFSVASISTHWVRGGDNPLPRTQAAADAMVLVLATLHLIDQLQPRFGFLIENPRGMLRKLSIMQHLPRRTVTYCQYGDTRQKPTDLFGYAPNWIPRPVCSPGMVCHESAPRGSRSGTQGIYGAKTRSMVPYDLGKEIRQAIFETGDIQEVPKEG